MRVRHTASAALAAVSTAAVWTGGACTPALDSERFNVLFISVDDLRPELGSYGAPVVTPNLDRLADSGMRFDRAYTQAAACAASRASMLTGAYPFTTGVYHMRPSLAGANSALVTMPRVFKDAGYETIEIGKFAHRWEDVPDGWSRARWLPEWNPPKYLDPRYRRYSGRRRKPRGPLSERVEVPDEAYLDGKLAAHAVEELRRLKDRSFFLAVGFVRPHLPFNCPAKYWDLYDRRNIHLPDRSAAGPVSRFEWHDSREPGQYQGGKPIDEMVGRRIIHGYRACVSYIDSQVGRLLDELDRLDLSDRTVVVLWGDHGWHLGEHGIWGKGTALEVALRIPLIMRVPGISGERSTTALVETVDLLPTLCELTGIPIPEQVEGLSFVPLLEHPERPWKRAVFGWRQRLQYAGQTVRTARYRLVRWVEGEGDAAEVRAVELYDHRTDPREQHNIAKDPAQAETVQRLNALLGAWLRREPVALLERRETSGSPPADDRVPQPDARARPLAVAALALVGVAVLWRSIAQTRRRDRGR